MRRLSERPLACGHKLRDANGNSWNFLLQAATLYRAVDHALRVYSGHAETRLPNSESQLDVLTRLVHRWNTDDAQANLWFVTGIGEAQTHDQATGVSATRTMFSPGTQFDYETRRVYFAATARLYRASGIDHDYGSVRGGFSFYETEYDETQPWFVLEARRMHDLSGKTEVTPMLRLVNKGLFVEAGVNNSRQPRLNFMYIF